MGADREQDAAAWHSQETVESWDQIEERNKRYACMPAGPDCYWIFRGDKPGAALATKLEQAFADYGVPKSKMRQHEMEMIREFQRKGGLYLDHEPGKDDVLEWLAIMRHYGAPTRLIDWTYSFDVAVHFALANDLEGTVWAFNAAKVNKPELARTAIAGHGGGDLLDGLQRRLSGMDNVLTLRQQWDKLDDLAIASCLLLAENPTPLVFALNPFRLNRRLIIQQTLFLISGDIRLPFVENLRYRYGHDDATIRRHMHRIILKPDRQERNRILREKRFTAPVWMAGTSRRTSSWRPCRRRALWGSEWLRPVCSRSWSPSSRRVCPWPFRSRRLSCIRRCGSRCSRSRTL